MELVDLCPLEKWDELERRIRERSGGLAASVFDTEGIRIIQSHYWPNSLCPEIKALPKGQSFICATAHMNIANQARAARGPVIEECDAGLVKLVVPIFVDELFLGAVGACGLLLEEGAVDSFLVNKMTDLPEEKVERLSEGIGAISLEQAEALCAFIQRELQAIVDDFKAGRHSSGRPGGEGRA